MTAAMAHHYPKPKGIVFDLPPVAKRATGRPSSGSPTASRRSAAASRGAPAALSSCDAFYLKFILHDWADEARLDPLGDQGGGQGGLRSSPTHHIGVDGANMETSSA